TDAMRAGDFSSSGAAVVDPSTGRPFPGNQIPAGRIDPTAAALMPYIPSPNLPGATRNYHVSTLAPTSSEAVSPRLTQNLSKTPPAPPTGGGGRGAGGGGGGFGRGGFGAGGGGRGPGARANGTNVVLNAQLQYRENTSESVNVFPGLGGETTNRSLT